MSDDVRKAMWKRFSVGDDCIVFDIQGVENELLYFICYDIMYNFLSFIVQVCAKNKKTVSETAVCIDFNFINEKFNNLIVETIYASVEKCGVKALVCNGVKIENFFSMSEKTNVDGSILLLNDEDNPNIYKIYPYIKKGCITDGYSLEDHLAWAKILDRDYKDNDAGLGDMVFIYNAMEKYQLYKSQGKIFSIDTCEQDMPEEYKEFYGLIKKYYKSQELECYKKMLQEDEE